MEQFFEFALERHRIYNRRAAGAKRPWTSDPVLHKYRFTNVYRELDATTVWFRENVREKNDNTPEVLLATVLFRWFNRVKTGEAIFCQLYGDSSGSARTPWRHLMVHEHEEAMEILGSAIRSYCRRGPYVTGAYIIKSPNGRDKLSGVLDCVSTFMRHHQLHRIRGRESATGWREAAQWMESGRGSVKMEEVWEWLRRFPYMGNFMAYEVVTDLRHTYLLRDAPDIMKWANPGPGAMRGLNRLHGRQLSNTSSKSRFIREMRQLLEASDTMWPNSDEFPPLEMRDVEHTLCEFDKYQRAVLGEGRPRGVYR